MKKCVLCSPFGIFLGHFVCREVMLMEPVKFEIIVDLPHPVSVKQLRTMLGHTSCYKKFIWGYAEVSAPMDKMLKKDVKFHGMNSIKRDWISLKKR